MAKRRSLLLAIVITGATLIGLQVASAQGSLQWADAFRFMDAPDFQDSGNAWLLRTDDNITTGGVVYDVEPGAYSMWWLVWNTPEGCLEAWACSEADLSNPDANLAVGYAGGASVGSKWQAVLLVPPERGNATDWIPLPRVLF